MIRLNSVEIEKKHFPDGTFCLLDIDSDKYRLLNEEMPNNIEWYYSGEDECSLLMMLKMFLDEYQLRMPVNLWLYYIPNARMDRVKKDCEVFTLKFFARFINSLCFNRVFVYDPHSNVSQALFNNVVVLHENLHDNIVNFLKRVECNAVYFPDESAMKRYGDIVNDFNNQTKETSSSPNTKIFYAEKHREWETGEIKGIEIKSPSNLTVKDLVKFSTKNIVIIDDIISHGGSIYYGLKKLVETEGFDFEDKKIYIYASHVENSITEGKLWEEFIKPRKVFLTTTKSIEHTQEVLDYVAELDF